MRWLHLHDIQTRCCVICGGAADGDSPKDLPILIYEAMRETSCGDGILCKQSKGRGRKQQKKKQHA